MAAKKKKKKKRSPSGALVKTAFLSTSALQRKAEADFIKDEDSNGVDWHYRNGDPDYTQYIAIDTFRSWAKKGGWVQKRIQYWRVIQERLLSHLADKLLEKKITELGEMQVVRDAIVERLMPKRDPKTGDVLRDDDGLPEFSLELPSYEKMAKVWLDLDLRMGIRTGEAVGRIGEREEGASVLPRAIDPVTSVMAIDESEAQMLARKLLLSRNAHLEDEDVIDVEAEVEDESGAL